MPSQTPSQAPFQPIITLIFDRSDDGSYFVRFEMRGLANEAQAEFVAAELETKFCGVEIKPS